MQQSPLPRIIDLVPMAGFPGRNARGVQETAGRNGRSFQENRLRKKFV